MFRGLQANDDLFRKIRVMANGNRFRILELTEKKALNITELKKETNLAYTKCADYVRLLEKEGLIEKTKVGREMEIKSRVSFKTLQNCFR